MPSDAAEDDKQSELNDQDAKLEGLACNGCRKAKLRCSRSRPKCWHCRKASLDCVYETKRAKPGLKAGAVENLHRRMGENARCTHISSYSWHTDDLERRFDEKDTAQTQFHNNGHPIHSPTVSEAPDKSTAYDILALLARELPKLVDASTPKANVSHPPSEQPSRKRQRMNEEVSDDFVSVEQMPALPDSQVVQAVIAAYFCHVHPWIPMIHQARFLQRMIDDTAHTQLMLILQAMMIAASKYVLGSDAYVNVTRNRKWVVYTAMETLSLESLQALIILAFDDIGSGRAAKAWSIIGSMTRTAEYMQLAQEHEYGEHRPFCPPYASLRDTNDWTELEERRRVFWNVFLLDRFCSVTMGWNTSLTSDDVYRRLPCDGYLWRKGSPVQTPYFGIWEKSKGRIGNPIGYVTRFPSPMHSTFAGGPHNPVTTDPRLSK